MEKISIGDRAFAVAGLFLLGIFVANEDINLYIPTIIGFICTALCFICLKKWVFLKFLCALFLASATGVIYYHVFVGWQASHQHFPSTKQATFFATVSAQPETAGNFTLLAAKLERPYSGSLDIFISPQVRFNYGDLLWVKGTIIPPKATGASFALFFPELRVVAQGQGSWFMGKMIGLQSYIVQQFQRILPTDEAALLSAIILGLTNTLSSSLKAQMEASGTSYITGMYGYKIAVLIAFLGFILKDHISRKVLFFLTLACIWGFAAASGAGISVIRAAIMGSVMLIARVLGKIFSVRNALMFTAIVMAIIDPTVLLSVPFQFSFLSFLGIYYLGPPIRYFFHWNDGGILDWKEHAMLSLATNLAIIPIVIKTFGDFSVTSFFSNILIMIPWPAVLLGGVCIVIAGFISPYLTFLVGHAMGILLNYELFIIKLFALLVMPIPQVFDSSIVVVLYYGALMIFAYYYATPSQENH